MKRKSFNFHKFMVILRKYKNSYEDSFKIFLNFFCLNFKILRQKKKLINFFMSFLFVLIFVIELY